MPEFKKLQCSKCGVTVDAGCDCGVAYVPANEIVKEAIKLNPDLSNREIARNIGTSYQTVRRERNRSVDTNVSTENKRRVGRDGKSYKARKIAPLPVLDPERPANKRAVTKRAAALEARIEKLEKTYKRILEVRKRGAISHNLYRSIKALLYHPQNVSEAKLQTLRVEWDIYGWLLAEKQQSTPSLTDVDTLKEEAK